ncbi:class I SAM-dependent methyltransferase [Rhodobacter ferrooxidans]|nr:class I SAM-dependent methyltransferase [Rhodobacter sp. SW2]
MFRRAVSDAEQLATASRQEGEDYVLFSYPDYDTYRKVQEAGNKAKLGAQYVKKSHIFFLARHLTEALGQVGFGLCHGVRRGKEQAWFRRVLKGAEVIGTDISETATQFPNTVQWDFHEPNPAWAGKADFVYSNSWDHAYDPGKAFRAWVESLKPGGVLLLDHSAGHQPRTTNALDPFGATEAGLMRILAESCGDLGQVSGVLDRSTEADYPCRVVVFTRSAVTAEAQVPAAAKTARPKAAAKPKPAPAPKAEARPKAEAKAKPAPKATVKAKAAPKAKAATAKAGTSTG